MNKLKRTLALVATLAISATAFVGCGDDNNSSSSVSYTHLDVYKRQIITLANSVFRILSAWVVAPTETPRKIVIMFIKAF